MANKVLFTSKSRRPKKADTVNRAGGKAYSHSSKHKLAQLAAVGCINNTYYVSAKEQLKEVVKLASSTEPEFLAKVAIYSRKAGFMKDMPALLTVALADRLRAVNTSSDATPAQRMKLERLHAIAFTNVIDNAKMARNYMQIIRSGVFGWSTPGRQSRRLMRNWLNSSSPDYLFRQSVGNDPSVGDIIKMVRPKPEDARRSALYTYLAQVSGQEGEGKFNSGGELLPGLVKHWEIFKNSLEGEAPNVPFQMLSSLKLSEEHWKSIAKNAPWMMTRMNLNTFARHGVFKDSSMIRLIAERLRDAEAIKRARQFPYHMYSAYKNVGSDVPPAIKNALQDAANISLGNVPKLDAELIIVVPDVSGSMGSAITGGRGKTSSTIKCVEVAALIASAIARKNEDNTLVWPVDTSLHLRDFNPRDSLVSNTRKLSGFGGGGTNLSLPLEKINRDKLKPDLVVFISDYESWADNKHNWWGNSTNTEVEWNKLRARHKKARKVAIDLNPMSTSQTSERPDVLKVGGFSDSVFNVIASYCKSDLTDSDYWVKLIESSVDLDQPNG